MTNSGPHQSDMGKREFRQILTASFRASGQVSGAPSSVSDQDFARISAPISPPPARKWGKAIMPLLPASSASRYRSDIEATVRFAEETYADKVFEQHLVRRHVYLPTKRSHLRGEGTSILHMAVDGAQGAAPSDLSCFGGKAIAFVALEAVISVIGVDVDRRL